MNGRLLLLAALGGAALLAALARAAAPDPVALDPAAAGSDYALQGEYLGEAGGARLGAQVVALGGGRFQAVFLPGGLPGDGWDGRSRFLAEGHAEGGSARFGTPGAEWSGAISGGIFTGHAAAGMAFTLRRIERASPTLGMPAPTGALRLFDGRGTSEWEQARLTPEGLLLPGARTKRLFRDFTLHAEFRTPFRPLARGQERGNSGLYLLGRYEIQILDSFGAVPPRSNDCGGLYRQKAPDVNMCLPPLAWQTFDIEFRAPRFDERGTKTQNAVVTVRHNGVLIHDRVELIGHTGNARLLPETAAPGPLVLQDHGNPVQFRNLWLVERSDAALARPSAAADSTR